MPAAHVRAQIISIQFWREKGNEFGEDILKKHYLQEKHLMRMGVCYDLAKKNG